ncbi:MAG: ATP-dependent Clp protease ATP-binding subunit [Paludibacteraceae bacterium]|nr:ATP-dependent Clp protease ATP-binding subunit [Paludibacteraceae bacterium]
MTPNYSNNLNQIIQFAQEEAVRLGNTHVFPEHLFLGIIRAGEGNAYSILEELNVDVLAILHNIEANIRTNEEVDPASIKLLGTTNKILKFAQLESLVFKSEEVDSEHLLLAFLKEKSNAIYTFLEYDNIQYETVKEWIDNKNNQSIAPIEAEDFFEEEGEYNAMEDDGFYEEYDDTLTTGTDITAQLHDDAEDNTLQHHVAAKQNGQSAVKTEQEKSKTPVLDSFSYDLTQAAANGELDPVVGREIEIERLAQILSRRKKNNPVLIGEPGVGKSAIVEGLATRIVEKKAPQILLSKRIVSLDLASLVAGTKYRGQFEERLKKIIKELETAPHIVVFIDEIHTIVGAGSTPGSLDAANMMKPALARGKFQCIGATTLNEYRQGIEKDGALERRFQKITVPPTSEAETLTILRNIKKRYEEHHNVLYTDDALEACVDLTNRYITDRAFPDKAIDALDEAGSRTHLLDCTTPPAIIQLQKQIAEFNQLKLKAVQAEDFKLANEYKDKSKALQAELQMQQQAWENETRKNAITIDAEKVAEVVSMMSGVPVNRIAETEYTKLRRLNSTLKSKVIGQDSAIDTLSKAILRNRVGLKDPNKPIGSFMFLGPTGVGKTYLTKVLNNFMFPTNHGLIRIDMSEYMEKYSVSRLIGAPPGYVGYEEGGQLTEKVRRNPYSIVLFDEIEKAHPDVFNLLLQVLDEGCLTDSNGRKVDFKNTIIIMTSNIGTRQVKEFGQGVGFATAARTADTSYAQGVIRKALQKNFSPEFLNRIDEIIIFEQLKQEDIIKIIDIELEKVLERIKNIGFKLNVTDLAKNKMATEGYDLQFGARPLKRTIQKYIENAISEKLVTEEVPAGSTFTVDYNNESKQVECTL